MLKAAVIGLGVGEQHIVGYQAHAGCEVTAICDKDQTKLAEVSRRHPKPSTTLDAQEILKSKEIDVVSIASYDDAHYEQVILALENDKHVFVEKPLCQTEEQARKIRRLLQSKPYLHLSSNVPLRLSPRFVALRESVQRNEFGTLFHVEGDYDYGRRHKLTEGWRGKIENYSVVLGGAIHIVDLLLWITGQMPEKVLNATGNGIATCSTSFRSDDFVLATLLFPGGMTAKVTANLGCVSPHFHQIKIYGTQGTFINGIPDGVFYSLEGSSHDTCIHKVVTPYPGVAKGDLISSFVNEILTNAPGEVIADDVFATLSVCFAIERAKQTGKTTSIVSI